ncbi:hypothetical protein GCWU000325_01541 [Alloprevotella tannerae ATCC 51259]|uniref:Uncharacterized protein n=1 Tax=Alloprevotella tannerae ATCC 51259 TaxID=626522 RepID=C9LH40_9BACT|nr:hypothetical protein GCWU000325_01541 [Alloprevotella tannerae ATCC 51259]
MKVSSSLVEGGTFLFFSGKRPIDLRGLIRAQGVASGSQRLPSAHSSTYLG